MLFNRSEKAQIAKRAARPERSKHVRPLIGKQTIPGVPIVYRRQKNLSVSEASLRRTPQTRKCLGVKKGNGIGCRSITSIQASHSSLCTSRSNFSESPTGKFNCSTSIYRVPLQKVSYQFPRSYPLSSILKSLDDLTGPSTSPLESPS